MTHAALKPYVNGQLLIALIEMGIDCKYFVLNIGAFCNTK